MSLSFAGLCRSVALARGAVLSDNEVDYILWNETGFPSFFRDNPKVECTRQINEALDARGLPS